MLPILYGDPGTEMEAAFKRGEIVLGGCVITGNDPQWACRACGERFGG